MKLIKDLGSIYATSKSKEKKRYGLYECPKCLKEIRVATASVKNGNSTQCRSCARTKHGHRGHPLYTSWIGMKARCYNPSSDSYSYYGARGITIDNDLLDFISYKEYVESLPNYGKKYTDNYTVDRIDGNGNYSKGNLRWASKSEQVLNRTYRNISSNNSSGTRGVHYIKRDKVWIAISNKNKKRIVIGRFKNLLEAVIAKEKHEHGQY